MDELTIGELSRRSGVSQSALRFYERQGLIAARRTSGNQRRYPRVTLRRVALVQAGKAAGIPLERIHDALATLPPDKTPTKRDWQRLSSSWRRELDEGSNWEAVQYAGRARLDRLTAVVVDNRSARHGWPGGIAARFELEGWSADVADGRDHRSLERALKRRTGSPHVVVAEMRR